MNAHAQATYMEHTHTPRERRFISFCVALARGTDAPIHSAYMNGLYMHISYMHI